MCGRFTPLSLEQAELWLSYDTPFEVTDLAGSFEPQLPDVFPYRQAAVITAAENPTRLQVRSLSWGYIPVPGSDVVFNTRIETIDSLPLWIESYQKRRCIVPAFTFYERHQSEKAQGSKGKPVKQLYRFTVPGQTLLLMAGIWEDDHFSIVTCAPNQDMKAIHPRMPMVLAPHEAQAWMHGAFDVEALADRAGVPLQSAPVYPPLPEQLSLF